MNQEISILKGIHPGLVLEKKLKEHNLKKGPFALSINEYPQTLTAITKGKRDMNLPLALKIEEALGLEEGYFMLLQLYHDIKQEKLKRDRLKPDLSKFRKVLFWDTDINMIDWQRQSKAVIRRVIERGNEKEKAEIIRFYSKEKIDKALNNILAR
jgi:plasmid maintenance system antidote protein VapI